MRANSTSGFTLLEILVGMSLSIVVLAGVIALYIPALQSWNTTANLSDLQEMENTLQDLLGNRIRQSGLLGCRQNVGPIDGIEPNVATAGVAAINRTAVTWAFPNQANGVTNTHFLKHPFRAFAADATIEAIPNLQHLRQTDAAGTIGDVFYTLSPTIGYYRIQSTTTGAGDKSITLQSSPGILAGQFFLVNDCNNTVLIRANADSTNVISYANNQLNTVEHPRNTVVTLFEPAVFYIRTPAANTSGLPTIATLYRRVISRALAGSAFQTIDTPLISGVENLRVEYGVAADPDAATRTPVNYIVTYVTSDNLGTATLDDVRAVRISVMLRAGQPQNNVTRSLRFPALDGTTPDCYGSAPPADACPTYVTSAAGRQFARKVIRFNYILPRFIRI